MWALFDQMKDEFSNFRAAGPSGPFGQDRICEHDYGIDDGMYVCRKCHCISKTVIDYPPCQMDPVSVPYKRLTHFRSTLTRLLGLETYVLPDDVLRAVQNENPSSIKQVKTILKERGFSKWYKHCYSIAGRCGVCLPFLSPKEYDHLVFLFTLFNSEYQKVSCRSNQLSYHFILQKFLLLIDRGDVVKYLNRLKSKSKLIEHEAIFKKCSHCFQ